VQEFKNLILKSLVMLCNYLFNITCVGIANVYT